MGELFFSLFLEMQYIRNQFDAYQILSENDLQVEVQASNYPAMNSATADFDFWASFNEWSCFPLEHALISTVRVNYHGPRDIPSIRIIKSNTIAYFDLSPHFRWKASHIVDEWYEITKDEKYICLFAAQLPKHKHTGNFELWYISRIKTLSGEWLEDDEMEKSYY